MPSGVLKKCLLVRPLTSIVVRCAASSSSIPSCYAKSAALRSLNLSLAHEQLSRTPPATRLQDARGRALSIKKRAPLAPIRPLRLPKRPQPEAGAKARDFAEGHFRDAPFNRRPKRLASRRYRWSPGKTFCELLLWRCGAQVKKQFTKCLTPISFCRMRHFANHATLECRAQVSHDSRNALPARAARCRGVVSASANFRLLTGRHRPPPLQAGAASDHAAAAAEAPASSNADCWPCISRKCRA
jgi:hypothetical protein